MLICAFCPGPHWKRGQLWLMRILEILTVVRGRSFLIKISWDLESNRQVSWLSAFPLPLSPHHNTPSEPEWLLSWVPLPIYRDYSVFLSPVWQSKHGSQRTFLDISVQLAHMTAMTWLTTTIQKLLLPLYTIQDVLSLAGRSDMKAFPFLVTAKLCSMLECWKATRQDFLNILTKVAGSTWTFQVTFSRSQA